MDNLLFLFYHPSTGKWSKDWSKTFDCPFPLPPGEMVSDKMVMSLVNLEGLSYRQPQTLQEKIAISLHYYHGDDPVWCVAMKPLQTGFLTNVWDTMSEQDTITLAIKREAESMVARFRRGNIF